MFSFVSYAVLGVFTFQSDEASTSLTEVGRMMIEINNGSYMVEIYGGNDWYIHVGKANGSVYTWGVNATYEVNNSWYRDLIALNDTHVVVGYEDIGSYYNILKVVKINDTNITNVGPIHYVNESIAATLHICTLSEDKILISYIPDGWQEGYLLVGTINGLNITFGPETIFNTGQTEANDLTAINSTHAILNYEQGNLEELTMRIIRVDGTTITMGDPTVLISGAPETDYASFAVVNETHLALAYRRGLSSNISIIEINNLNDVTIYDPVWFGNTSYDNRIIVMPNNQLILSWTEFEDTFLGRFVRVNVTGTTTVIEEPTSFYYSSRVVAWSSIGINNTHFAFQYSPYDVGGTNLSIWSIPYIAPPVPPVLVSFNVDNETGANLGWDLDNNDVQVDYQFSHPNSTACYLLWTFSLGGTPSDPTNSSYHGRRDLRTPETVTDFDLDWSSGVWEDYSGAITIKMVIYDGGLYSNILSDSLSNGIDGTTPSSTMADIPGYIRSYKTITLTATATDSPSAATIYNVTLYYSYSTDNSSWSSWTLFQTDYSSPYSWKFTYPAGVGWYKLGTRALDLAGNLEAQVTDDTIYYDAGYEHESGTDLVERGLGVAVGDLILFVLTCSFIIVAAVDVRIAAMFATLLYSVLFIIYFETTAAGFTGFDPVRAGICVAISIVVLALLILAAGKSKSRMGYIP